MAGKFTLLLTKEVRLFRRNSHVTAMFGGFSLLLSLVAAVSLRYVGISSTQLELVYVGALWLIFLFCGVGLIQFLWQAEVDDSAYRGVTLASGSDIEFLSAKIAALSVALFLLQSVTATFLAVLLGVTIWGIALPLLGLFAIAAISFASLGVLLAALAASSAERSILFPILFYPLLIPFLWALVSECGGVFRLGAIDLGGIPFLFLVSFGVLSAALVLLVGGSVVRD